MKKSIGASIIFLKVLLISQFSSAQAPSKMSYQAILRDAAGNLIKSAPVGIRFSILQGSPGGLPVYVETQNPTTNTNGLISAIIGDGFAVSGTMGVIDWSSGPYFLNLETDPTGGTSYTISSTTQLLSVPYALFAQTSGKSLNDTVFYAKTTGHAFISDTIKILDTVKVYDTTVNAWHLNGNDLTLHSGRAFIGTTSPASLEFRVDNIPSGIIDLFGAHNTGFGLGVLNNLTVGLRNTAFGYKALSDNTSGQYNLANGYEALLLNTTGNANTAIGASSLDQNTSGNNNTGVGTFTLTYNTTGNDNTASGFAALTSNSSGNSNVANGANALYTNTTGSKNTANGYMALYSNYTGSENTATGYRALYSNTTANGNTANGYLALHNNTTGNGNTAIGNSTMQINSTGNNNTSVGAYSLNLNTTGSNNTVNGNRAMQNNISGSNNTANGYNSLSYNTTGTSNSAIGQNSLYRNTTGSYNTANGALALGSDTTGSNNTASGYGSLASNSSGSNNSANGAQSLYSNSTGEFNVANGSLSLYSNIVGSSNTANGYKALYVNLGSENTASGKGALITNLTGNNNTAFGFSSDVSAPTTISNAVVVGSSATVNASNKIRLGNTSITTIEGQVAYSYPSDARFKNNIKNNIPGLAFINQLRPVSYTFDTKKFDEHLMQNMPDSLKQIRMGNIDYTSSAGIIHSGFIAQDIEKVCKDIGYSFDGLHVPDPANKSDNYSVAYSQFIMPLVKAVQEQQGLIEKLEKRIAELEAKK